MQRLKRNRRKAIVIQWMLLLLFLNSLLTVWGHETRCVCFLHENTQLLSYDLEQLNLVLPCVYRLTSIGTLNSRYSLTVDLSMKAEGDSTKPDWMKYHVTSDQGQARGLFDSNGIRSIDNNINKMTSLPLDQRIFMEGIELFPFIDNRKAYNLALPQILVSLTWGPGLYLGVYSHNSSSDYIYYSGSLCGDCDGTRNELESLHTGIRGSMTTLRDMDAAMFYLTSSHIVGGSQRCHDYRNLINSCPREMILDALKICGGILDPRNSVTQCLHRSTLMTHRLDTFFDCAVSFCSGNRDGGCRHIRMLTRFRFCRFDEPGC